MKCGIGSSRKLQFSWQGGHPANLNLNPRPSHSSQGFSMLSEGSPLDDWGYPPLWKPETIGNLYLQAPAKNSSTLPHHSTPLLASHLSGELNLSRAMHQVQIIQLLLQVPSVLARVFHFFPFTIFHNKGTMGTRCQIRSVLDQREFLLFQPRQLVPQEVSFVLHLLKVTRVTAEFGQLRVVLLLFNVGMDRDGQ